MEMESVSLKNAVIALPTISHVWVAMKTVHIQATSSVCTLLPYTPRPRQLTCTNPCFWMPKSLKSEHSPVPLHISNMYPVLSLRYMWIPKWLLLYSICV